MQTSTAASLLGGLTSGRLSMDQCADQYKAMNRLFPSAKRFAVDAAIAQAKAAGFAIGRTVLRKFSDPVKIGVVVGFNTSTGLYSGDTCPVLIAADNGVFEYSIEQWELTDSVVAVTAMDAECNLYASRVLPFGCHVEVDRKHYLELEVRTESGYALKKFPFDQVEIYRPLSKH